VTGSFLSMKGQHHDVAAADNVTEQLRRTESQSNDSRLPWAFSFLPL
jgi:hypothetical protein